MHRPALVLAVAALVAAAGPVLASPGAGAQKAGLAAVDGLSPLGCASAADADRQTSTGFAVLNAPGKPGSPRKVVGEVAVTDAEPGRYDLRLVSPGSDGCGDAVGTLVVGEDRRGRAAVAGPAAGQGTYYVVLTQALVDGLQAGAVQRYASGAVSLR